MSADQRHILLLQGPLGPFFRHLAEDMKGRGWRVTRVCFNGGDEHYAGGDRIVPYQGKPEEWKPWLENLLASDPADAIVLYGDSRFYHQIAREIASEKAVPVLCLEEGYIRPGFITAEWGGNNANSPLMKCVVGNPGQAESKAVPEPVNAGPVFGRQAHAAIIYYIWRAIRRRKYRWLRHHRPGGFFLETFSWTVAGPRKWLNERRDERALQDLEANHISRYFVVPLQVAVDSQIIHHSPFETVADSIRHILSSFAEHAPSTHKLVFKHHPMDRGFHHYGSYIDMLAKELGCHKRIVYGFQFDLERLLASSAGCVTVNSTVGIDAIKADVPTFALGTALYAAAGLAAREELDAFWSDPVRSDSDLFRDWEKLVKAEALLPGSFYRCQNLATDGICNMLATGWSKTHG